MTIPAKNLYETDFYLWIEATAKLLRCGELDKVDLENLIEEIEAMGRSEKNALESNLRVLLMHLLKWKFQPSKRSNSWRATIAEHAYRIKKVFKSSPSLSRYFDEILAESYAEAKKLAAFETGLTEDIFPVVCPFTKENILNPDYLPLD